MTESFRALCNDFYVNLKLSVRMELPRTRETVLDLFERIRRQFPHMNAFRKYRDELALESPQTEMPHRWAAIRETTGEQIGPPCYTLSERVRRWDCAEVRSWLKQVRR